MGIRCFFDEDSLKLGDEAADKLLAAMETVEYGIVILSPGFFSREWCMKELQTFVRRRRVLPIFFSRFEAVEYGKADAIDKKVWTTFKRFVQTEEEYLDAVNASFTGFRRESVDGRWNTCIHQVRDEMLGLLGKIHGGPRLSEESLLVGQHEHLLKLKQLLGLPLEGASASASGDTSGEVGIVGVRGMGGVGKSTLAKKLFDEPDVRNWFGGKVCWLEIGQNPTSRDICKMQEQILEKLCAKTFNFNNPTVGRAAIRETLRGQRVLICLDDIWGDLEIVRAQDLGPGSRVLKTTRVKEAVGTGGVAYNLDTLERDPAMELFCWHAFDGRKPPSELAGLVEQAVERCGGLPLTIKILGCQLADADDKQGRLEDSLKVPADDDVMSQCRNTIRGSYDHLPDDPPGLKDVFLLVAGFWPSTARFREQERSIENLAAAVYGDGPVESREHTAKRALELLINRSLIELRREGDGFYIGVHDLLVNVATTIINQGRWARTGRFFCWVPGDADFGPTGVNWAHVRVLAGSIHSGVLMTPNGRIQSFVAEAQPALDCESIPQGSGPCRFLSLGYGFQLPPLQLLQCLQCLRLHDCQLGELPDGITCLKSLNVLEIKKCEGKPKHVHLASWIP